MYYHDTAENAAGALLSKLQPLLIANGWDLLGTSATNKKVFHSPGSSTTDNIIIEIDDSNIAYTGFRAATAYDDGTKQFTNPTTIRYMMKAQSYSTPFWFFVDANHFTIAAKCLRTGVNNYDTVYCGLPTRYETTNTFAVICTGATTSGSALGILHSTSLTGNLGQILKDYIGQVNKTFGAIALNTCFGDGQLPNVADGKMIISPIIIGISAGEITGELIDVFSIAGSSIAPEDTLTKDADEYLCMLTGTYKIAIKK